MRYLVAGVAGLLAGGLAALGLVEESVPGAPAHEPLPAVEEYGRCARAGAVNVVITEDAGGWRIGDRFCVDAGALRPRP